MYRIKIIPSARKDLEALRGKLFEAVEAAIFSLGENPRPPGSLKLSDEENGYRVRVRDLRILYRIHDQANEVIIYRVKHRKEAYR
jgi:mRNA interferase RelE/StbE